MSGLTLDTGALIALERCDRRTMLLVDRRRPAGTVTVPTAVLAEWWQGQPRARAILDGLVVEPLSERVAKIAGQARAATGSIVSAVDAIVMASAAQRGDVVLTSDVPDLERLRAVFRDVRLLRA